MMEEVLIPVLIVAIMFLGLPWVIFHYVTMWKRTATMTNADEKLLDELYELARRLDERLCTIERIMTADNPDWRQQCLPGAAHPLDSDRRQSRILTEERP